MTWVIPGAGGESAEGIGEIGGYKISKADADVAATWNAGWAVVNDWVNSLGYQPAETRALMAWCSGLIWANTNLTPDIGIPYGERQVLLHLAQQVEQLARDNGYQPIVSPFLGEDIWEEIKESVVNPAPVPDPPDVDPPDIDPPVVDNEQLDRMEAKLDKILSGLQVSKNAWGTWGQMASFKYVEDDKPLPNLPPVEGGFQVCHSPNLERDIFQSDPDQRSWSIDEYLGLCHNIGVTSINLWMWHYTLFHERADISIQTQDYYKEFVDGCRAREIDIVAKLSTMRCAGSRGVPALDTDAYKQRIYTWSKEVEWIKDELDIHRYMCGNEPAQELTTSDPIGHAYENDPGRHHVEDQACMVLDMLRASRGAIGQSCELYTPAHLSRRWSIGYDLYTGYIEGATSDSHINLDGVAWNMYPVKRNLWGVTEGNYYDKYNDVIHWSKGLPLIPSEQGIAKDWVMPLNSLTKMFYYTRKLGAVPSFFLLRSIDDGDRWGLIGYDGKLIERRVVELQSALRESYDKSRPS